MIQLATDPTAGKMSYRSSQEGEGRAHAFEAQRGRSGHAWPFIARQADRPTRPESQKPTAADNGS